MRRNWGRRRGASVFEEMTRRVRVQILTRDRFLVDLLRG
jgi:hypothetical protein